MDISKRDSSLDVIRIFATFCVVAVHFFANNGFYVEKINDSRMFIPILVRTFFMVCVPLFITLTGYLMCKKTLSGKYYKGIIKTLVIYLLVSLVTIVYKHNVINDIYDVKRCILAILNFEAATYSWYIEMYIGLFLMIPFLNLAYNGLTTKRHKQILVLTFIGLTVLPAFSNSFCFNVEDWWRQPSVSAEYNQLIPDWWCGMYPLAYYFIGCYIREFGIKINKIINTLIILITLTLATGYIYYRSFGNVFVYAAWNEWAGLFTLILTTLVFTIILGTKWINNLPPKAKACIKYLSELTLGAYLISYIFDNYFYTKLNTAVPVFYDKQPYFFIIVPLVFICSMLASAVINLFYSAALIIIDSIRKASGK